MHKELKNHRRQIKEIIDHAQEAEIDIETTHQDEGTKNMTDIKKTRITTEEEKIDIEASL